MPHFQCFRILQNVSLSKGVLSARAVFELGHCVPVCISMIFISLCANKSQTSSCIINLGISRKNDFFWLHLNLLQVSFPLPNILNSAWISVRNSMYICKNIHVTLLYNNIVGVFSCKISTQCDDAETLGRRHEVQSFASSMKRTYSVIDQFKSTNSVRYLCLANTVEYSVVEMAIQDFDIFDACVFSVGTDAHLECEVFYDGLAHGQYWCGPTC